MRYFCLISLSDAEGLTPRIRKGSSGFFPSVTPNNSTVETTTSSTRRAVLRDMKVMKILDFVEASNSHSQLEIPIPTSSQTEELYSSHTGDKCGNYAAWMAEETTVRFFSTMRRSRLIQSGGARTERQNSLATTDLSFTEAT